MTTTKKHLHFLYSQLLCALTGICLGLWAMFTTQSVTNEMFEPIVASCSTSNGSGSSNTSTTDTENSNPSYELHPYEPLLGGTFVCLVTQFLHELIQHPGGIFTWGVIASMGIVSGILMNVEADRGKTRGLIRYPTFVGALSQIFGISVVFTLLWVPGYCYSQYMNHGSDISTPTMSRVHVATAMSLLFPFLTLLVFNLDPSSYAWTFSAGLLGGPLVACSPILFSFLPYEKPSENELYKAGVSHILSKAYFIAAIISFVGYMINVRLITKIHGADFHSIFKEIWTNAHPSVAFMTIDILAFFLGILLYISIQKRGMVGVLKVVITAPFVGPGSACAIVLWEQEHRRAISFLDDADEKEL
mmetsp:Transcript_25427/g.31329  ORF Transcript_25427/g.31329 Transcript_25427/m.31329 type:complete len:360 (+) Transcript_25427:86-1165(+)